MMYRATVASALIVATSTSPKISDLTVTPLSVRADESAIGYVCCADMKREGLEAGVAYRFAIRNMPSRVAVWVLLRSFTVMSKRYRPGSMRPMSSST